MPKTSEDDSIYPQALIFLYFLGNHPLPKNQGEGLSTHVFLSNPDDPGFVMLRFLDVAGLNVFAEPFSNTYFPKFLFSHLASLK